MTETERLISVSYAARRLQVCRETIRRWLKAGKLRGVKYPTGRFAVKADDVETILSTPATPATSKPPQ